MMRHEFLAFSLLLALLPDPGLAAQKLLQLEKAGSTKLIRYYIGDEIVFRLHNDDKGWYSRVINDIDIENESLIFPNYTLPIDSIAMIQLPKSKFWQFFGTALQAGGGGIILSSAGLAAAQGSEFPTAAITTGAVNMAVGTGLKQWKTKRFKVSARKRLRVLDLTFRFVPEDRT